jgi:hypothetical protein
MQVVRVTTLRDARCRQAFRKNGGGMAFITDFFKVAFRSAQITLYTRLFYYKHILENLFF